MKKSIIIPILFMAAILILCSLPMNKIENQIKCKFSGLTALKGQIQNISGIRIKLSTIQNILHVPFFALLAFFWMKFFSRRKTEFKKAFIYTVIITFFFSGLEEFIQFFIAGRDASFGDLFLNFTGCLTGVGVYKLASRQVNQPTIY